MTDFQKAKEAAAKAIRPHVEYISHADSLDAVAAALSAFREAGYVLVQDVAIEYIRATEHWELQPHDAKERTSYFVRSQVGSLLPRPMETAPLDTREVLLFCGQWVCGHRTDDLKDPERLDSGYVTDCTWPGMTAPTAWAPVPADPAMLTAAQKEQEG